jgi:hypothetical protein
MGNVFQGGRRIVSLKEERQCNTRIIPLNVDSKKKGAVLFTIRDFITHRALPFLFNFKRLQI